MTKKKLLVVGLGLAAAAGSAMADAAGAPASTIDTTAAVQQINGLTVGISAIGGALIAVAVLALGYRLMKGFVGR
ncbi:major capsid protein [Trinickia fusca]|uniref:Methyltransferase n=1 Tax=Trinickia fusca TaxID=2419777 RepID=A0A494XB31_9BURK|nr:major capsid protein [Trinickia fusca]RKP46851.1 hypothetical protein D7S89_15955 [Trinickia fusca]